MSEPISPLRLAQEASIPPTAARRPTKTSVHGEDLVDDYAWLRASNWQDVLRNPSFLARDIRDHLEAENAYGAGVMADTEPLREQLVAEMRGRIKEDDSSVPMRDGPFAYLSRYRDGGQHPLICRQAPDGSAEQVLLDGDALAAGLPFFDLGGWHQSPDHRLLAWSADEKGSELHTIRVREIETGIDRADAIPGTTGEIVWTSDSQSFLYVELDEDHRPRRVKRHRLGEPAESDILVYEEGAQGWFIDIDRTQSGRFGLVNVSNHETSEAPRPRAAGRAAPDGRAAPQGRALRRRSPRRETRYPHQ
jgi:oligopeptidase B